MFRCVRSIYGKRDRYLVGVNPFKPLNISFSVMMSDECFQSEERGKKESPAKSHLRPMARSTDASLDHMRGGGSSPSVLAGSPEAEDDCGMYSEPFSTAAWIFISNLEEMRVWHKAPPADTLSQGQ